MLDPATLSEIPPVGANLQLDGTLSCRVWAPYAQSVELVWIGSDGERRAIPMQAEPHGYFSHFEAEVEEGQRYAYCLNGGLELPDPASRWQPEGVNRPSAVCCPQFFPWSDAEWAGVPRQDLVLYELHVGTFTTAGTFDAVIPRLRQLRDMGVTALEIMPIAQFPGDRNWGYDGVHPFAVQNTYGGPHGFQRLVDACHRVGLAVILDVVYNHLGPEGNYLREFGPYFTDEYRTPWGTAVNFDERGSDGVRAFFLENVRHWVRDYHVDGLRLDAIHAIYDLSPRHILREIKEIADEEAARQDRCVHIIAESDLNDVRLINPTDQGGYGLDAQWSDDFHHCVHTLLTGERTGYYADFGTPAQLVKALNQTFVYDGCYSPSRDRRHGAPAGEHPGDRFVTHIQNHDQIGNRAMGDRFGTLLSPGQQRLAAGLLLLAPHIPLLFMGEEYGETRPFPFFCSFLDPQLIEAVRIGRRREFESFAWVDEIPDPQAVTTFASARLSWSWPTGTWHAGLRMLYQDLLASRARWPALKDFTRRQAELVDPQEEAVLRLSRGGSPDGPENWLVAYFNLSGQEQPRPVEEFTHAPPLLDSEEPRYGGSRAAGDTRPVLLPYEFQVFGTR